MQVSGGVQRLRTAFWPLLAFILVNGLLIWRSTGSLANDSTLALFVGRFQSNVAYACTILPSTEDSLRVELCYTKAACNSGTVTITAPADHCSSVPRKSADPDHLPEAYLAPHVFQLQLHGAARAALRAESSVFLGARRCAWKIAFDARTAGSIGFQVDHLRVLQQGASSDYLLESDFQPLIQTSSQDRPLNATGTTSRELEAFYPAVNMCPPENASTLVKTARARTVAPCANGLCTLAESSNPTCSRQRPIRGVYRPAHELDLQEGARSAVTHQGYVWEPESFCTVDRLPHAYTSPEEVDDLMNKHARRVVFIGDSHARYAYRLLTSWYGQNWTYLKDPHGTKDMAPWSRGRVEVAYVLDPQLSIIPSTSQGNCTEFLKQWGAYDTFVLSAGHHLAITDTGSTPSYPRNVTTTSEYVALVRENIQALLHACGRSESPAPRIIWLGTPAFAPSVHSRAKPWKDHRTNTRLSVWTRQAEDMLRRDFPISSVALVDQYALTLPWIHHTSDGLHFFRTDAAYAIVQELHHKIGLGRASGWWHVYDADAADD